MPSSSARKPHTDDRHFLRSGADADCPHGDESLAGHCHGTSSAAQWWPLPPGVQSLMEAMTQWERFVVLAVDIDAAGEAKISANFSKDLKQSLAQIADDHRGLWFPWHKNRFGVVVPGINAAEAESMALALQTTLAQRHIETISIGISEFPFQDFTPTQCLINAAKALDHGAFFGAESRVIFDSVSLNISADRYYQAGDLDQAMDEYRKALEADPDNGNARNSLGVCLAEKGDLEAARPAFEAVSRAHPHSADGAMAMFNLGLIDLSQGNLDDARSRFEAAHAADASFFEIPFQLGKLLCEQGHSSQAVKFLEAGEKIRDDYAPLYALMGACQADLQQTEAAIEAYKKAIKLSPNNAAALSGLGALYAEKGENIDICMIFCRQSVAIEPDNGLFHCRLARLYDQQDQLDQALNHYEKAAELGHDVAEPMNDLLSRLTACDDSSVRCA